MKINSIGNIMLLVFVVFTGCQGKIYTTDVFFCDDVLYAKKNNKVVNGKVYSVNEDGKIMSFRSFVNGITNGEFESWGYYGEVIHTGITKPFDLKGMNPLGKNNSKFYLTEFLEGGTPYRYITIRGDSLEPGDTIISEATKKFVKEFLEDNTGNAQYDRIIIEDVRNEEECSERFASSHNSH